MTFADFQTIVENHDPSDANEGEEVVAIEVEHVEALVEEEGGGLVSIRMMLSVSDHDSLQGVSCPFVCKLVHYFLWFATWGGYSYDLSI